MISIKKLERLLATKGFIIKKIFTIDRLCVYIEILCTSNGNIFMLYIPSKYDIFVKEDDNVFEITYFNIKQLGHIVEDYTQNPENIEEMYNEVDFDENNNKDIIDKLKSNYMKPISIKNMTEEDKQDIKDIYRQLKRLKLCVMNIKYKVSIQYKNFFAVVKRNNTIECYEIKNFPFDNNFRQLLVIVDLEIFYDTIDSLNVNICSIQDEIHKILDKNQIIHTRILKNLLDEDKDIYELSNNLHKKKQEYKQSILKLEDMLKELSNSEKDIVSKLVEIEDNYNDINKKGLHFDIEKTHLISKQESKLDKLNSVRQQILKNILEMKNKHEDTSLFIDKILFDNSVMLDAIIKNMKKAKEYITDKF